MPETRSEASLRERLVRELGERLAAADPGDAAAMRQQYRVLSEDYRTLALMDELPAHADGAHAAWRELVPDAPEAVSRQQLLGVLSDAYRLALPAPGRGADPDGPHDLQDGQ